MSYREERLDGVVTVRETPGDARQPAREATTASHMDAVTQVRFFNNDTHPALISGSRDGVVKIWK